MPRNNANLVIRSFDNRQELEVGKVVQYQGQWVIHCYVYSKYQRHSQGAWGVRAPVLRLMEKHGIETLYFWDNKKQVTYRTTFQKLRDFATPGKPDQFGGTMNLPSEHWTILPRLQVAWVPKEDRVILPAVELPWDMPTLAASKSVPKRAPAGETLVMPLF